MTHSIFIGLHKMHAFNLKHKYLSNTDLFSHGVYRRYNYTNSVDLSVKRVMVK